MELTTRIETIAQKLRRTYSPKIALNYTTPWELFIAVVLSAQCTDKIVNKVTPILFEHLKKRQIEYEPHIKKYTIKNKNKHEIVQILNTAYIPLAELEKLVKSTGFYKNKANNIQKAAQILLEKFGGVLPRTIADFTQLPGAARKSANVILYELYGVIEGIVVDTHVKRIAQRLRLVDPDKLTGKQKVEFVKNGKKTLDYKKDVSAEKVEKTLMKTLPKKLWGDFPHLLVKLGRDVCKAPTPNCTQCIIRLECPVARI